MVMIELVNSNNNGSDKKNDNDNDVSNGNDNNNDNDNENDYDDELPESCMRNSSLWQILHFKLTPDNNYWNFRSK